METTNETSEEQEKRTLKEFCKINKASLPLKTTLFFYYGGMAALLPYLTIHMQDIGISIQETAIIYGVLPFTTFLGPPLMGFLADKMGQYKVVIVLATILSGLLHTLLLAVPLYVEHPVEGATSFTHKNAFTYLQPSDRQFCDAFGRAMIEPDVALNISRCNQWNRGNEEDICNFYSSNNMQILQCSSASRNLNGVREYVGVGRLYSDTWNAGNCSMRIEIPNLSISNSTTASAMIFCETNVTFVTGEKMWTGNNSLTFWMYFVLRILATLFMTSCFSLLDATTLAVVKKNPNVEYGKERIWAILGMAIVSPIAGILVDFVSQSKGYTDYSAAFYVSNILLCFTIISYFFLELDIEKPEKSFTKNAAILIKYPEVDVFMVMMFILGNMWGFVESYLFIFLKELNAPNYLLGLTLTVGSLTGIPFLYGSEKILLKVGRVNLIVIAFLTYFVRFFGYSYIWNPFWCFPFEAMEAFTYHLMWVAGATYCGVLAPKGLLATLMGIIGSLHYSLGKGSGSFIGGYMMGTFGSRLTFRYFGVASGIFGIIYFVIHQLWLKSVVKNRQRASDEMENQEKCEQELVVEDQENDKSKIKYSESNGDGKEEIKPMLP